MWREQMKEGLRIMASVFKQDNTMMTIEVVHRLNKRQLTDPPETQLWGDLKNYFRDRSIQRREIKPN